MQKRQQLFIRLYKKTAKYLAFIYFTHNNFKCSDLFKMIFYNYRTAVSRTPSFEKDVLIEFGDVVLEENLS